MPTSFEPNAAPANAYDPRWFIWTIVFLVVTGISLVSYIMLSDSGDLEAMPVSASRIQLKANASTTTPQQPPAEQTKK